MDAGLSLAILLVDDDRDIRSTVCRVLEKQGHEVCEATNGLMALRALTARRFDLVITDVVMPDMEGLEFIRQVRRLTRSMKVIVISGGGRGAAEQYLALGLQFGADASLAKPFSAGALVGAVQRVMNESRPQ